MREATLIRTKGMIEAECPYCHTRQPIGVWAAAHLREILEGVCSSCQKKHVLRPERKS